MQKRKQIGGVLTNKYAPQIQQVVEPKAKAINKPHANQMMKYVYIGLLAKKIEDFLVNLYFVANTPSTQQLKEALRMFNKDFNKCTKADANFEALYLDLKNGLIPPLRQFENLLTANYMPDELPDYEKTDGFIGEGVYHLKCNSKTDNFYATVIKHGTSFLIINNDNNGHVDTYTNAKEEYQFLFVRPLKRIYK